MALLKLEEELQMLEKEIEYEEQLKGQEILLQFGDQQELGLVLALFIYPQVIVFYTSLHTYHQESHAMDLYQT